MRRLRGAVSWTGDLGTMRRDRGSWSTPGPGSTTFAARAPVADLLHALLGNEPLAIGDLILAKVLQGFVDEREFNRARRMLSSFQLVVIWGGDVAVAAARNHRRLRALGVTARKTIDAVIATRCIVDRLTLLHNDRDFDPFERHLGLRCLHRLG